MSFSGDSPIKSAVIFEACCFFIPPLNSGKSYPPLIPQVIPQVIPHVGDNFLVTLFFGLQALCLLIVAEVLLRFAGCRLGGRSV